MDTVVNGINYKRFFKGYLILTNCIEKWAPFMKITGINQFAGFSDTIKSIQKAYVSKHFDLAQAYVN